MAKEGKRTEIKLGKNDRNTQKWADQEKGIQNVGERDMREDKQLKCNAVVSLIGEK